jgi:hypothetical protein
MATERSLKIGSWVLAIALFGAVNLQTGFAQEPRSDARGDHPPSSASAPQDRQPLAGEDAAGSAATVDHHSGGRSDAGKVQGRETPPTADAPAKDRANTGDIDTSITVQPHRPHVRPGQAAQVKAKIAPPAAVNLRRPTSPAPAPIIRNAISAPVAVHAGGERRDATHLDAALSGHGAAGPTGSAGFAADRFAKTEGRIERPASNVNPIAAPAAPHRATVNGTGLIRRTVGPAALGGPATATAGINGTAIRPKH